MNLGIINVAYQPLRPTYFAQSRTVYNDHLKEWVALHFHGHHKYRMIVGINLFQKGSEPGIQLRGLDPMGIGQESAKDEKTE